VLLGFETQRVIGLRFVKLSRGGPAAQSEALRMVMRSGRSAMPRNGGPPTLNPIADLKSTNRFGKNES
jgi:hypothetical protein